MTVTVPWETAERFAQRLFTAILVAPEGPERDLDWEQTLADLSLLRWLLASFQEHTDVGQVARDYAWSNLRRTARRYGIEP